MHVESEKTRKRKKSWIKVWNKGSGEGKKTDKNPKEKGEMNKDGKMSRNRTNL